AVRRARPAPAGPARAAAGAPRPGTLPAGWTTGRGRGSLPPFGEAERTPAERWPGPGRPGRRPGPSCPRGPVAAGGRSAYGRAERDDRGRARSRPRPDALPV